MTAAVRGLAVRPGRFHPPAADAAREYPGQQYRRSTGSPCGAGPRAALMSWAAMKSASLTSAGCAGRFEITPPAGAVPPLHALVPKRHVTQVGQFGVGALPVPHPPARIARVPQDRGYRAQCPPGPSPVHIPGGIGADG